MSYWRKLNHLVPVPQCRTKDGVITEWKDARPQPSDNDINAVDINDVEARESENEAANAFDRKDLKALALVFHAELVALGSTITKAQLKQNFIDIRKTL